MADVLGVDLVEQILVRLDVEDLLRYKSVCKSWHSLISSPSFVTSHLKHALKSDVENHQLGCRRFVCDLRFTEEGCFCINLVHVVGTYNGLVCVSPGDVELVICNPSTRQKKELPSPPHRPFWRQGVCWGFGYDSYKDDYKVIVGFMKDKKCTLFYELTLKSNAWKFIGKVEYVSARCEAGTLCDGALHWFMRDHTNKPVILSLDLSTQMFKEIPQPYAEYGYEYCHGGLRLDVSLGVIEECLCISSHYYGLSDDKKWVMKNNKWELYTHHHGHKYDVVHSWIKTHRGHCYGDDGGTRLVSDGGYAPTSTYVKSLVSPRLLRGKGQEDDKCRAKCNIRKRKRKRSHKHNICKPFRLWN